MSDGDVTLIHDEDLLRRMWQQTEDFSRKKEIRAHMYRLREQRLRSLYDTQPSTGKGVESAQTHVQSLLDQSFQGLKSKEVRDAGSPPKDYRGQDANELSRGGWNVRSESSCSPDGRARAAAVHADVTGDLRVHGGAGTFAAAEHAERTRVQSQDGTAVTERDVSASSAHEHVQRRISGGEQSSTTTSSSSATRMHQTSPTGGAAPQTRDDDFSSGQLVARRVEHPDDNTTVVVETRTLADGSTVTATRRSHSAHSATSSAATTRASSRHTAREVVGRAALHELHDIVDSQRRADEIDFQAQHTQTREVSSNTSHKVDMHNENFDSQRCVENYSINENHKSDYSTNKEDHYSTSERRSNTNQSETRRIDIVDDSTTRQTNRHENHVDKIDRREHVTKHDQNNIDKVNRREYVTERDQKESDVKDIRFTKDTENTTVHTTRDKKTEDIEEKKTSGEYQTTYQTDFAQKKISNDWSPTQQAWASSLRGDSPAPAGRGSSPTKGARSTISTHSLTESTSSRYSSERKPPVSPTRHGGSPDRPRASQSPEKRPSDYRPRTSPDRKPGYSPDRKAGSRPPSHTSKSPSLSPDRYRRPTTTTNTTRAQDHYRFVDEETKVFTRSPSPSRRSPVTADLRCESPSILRKASRSPSPPKGPVTFTEDQVDKSVTNTADVSSKYDYAEDILKQYRSTPKRDSPSRATARQPSPVKYRSYDNKRTDVEETMTTTSSDIKYDSLTRRNKQSTTKSSTESPSSPTKTPVSDSHTTTPREPSPSKFGTYDKKRRSQEINESTFSVTDTNTYNYDSLTRRNKQTKTSADSPSSPTKTPVREPSPTKYGTNDHKRRSQEINETTCSVTDTNNFNYDSLTRRSKQTRSSPESPSSPTKTPVKDNRDIPSPREPSPTKYGTYDKKRRSQEINETTTTTDSTRRLKDISLTQPDGDTASPSKSNKYKHTTDFISVEKTSEEQNKKTRQLVTPSSSPTRRPRTEEAPSSGQSSPTTSVSGFVYFSSPKTESTIVTDLDDVDIYLDTKTTEQVTQRRPETLDIRSQLPTKIPCRSPSPEKRSSPNKECLPRKSSLKKPSAGFPQLSPTEKPPSNFRVSPTEEVRDAPDHKVVKKDRADKPVDAPKEKPPLERRETYEERCRKILGMIHDDSTKTTKKSTFTKDTSSKYSSPSVSPCASPDLATTRRGKDATSNVDFISREQQDTVTKTSRVDKVTSSRDTSPTKLKDIIDKNSLDSRHSPNRDIGYEKPREDSKSPDSFKSSSSRASPEKTLHDTKPSRSPERQAVYDRTSPAKSPGSDRTSKTPDRVSQSPERKPGYMKSTTASITKFESVTSEDLQEKTVHQMTNTDIGPGKSVERQPSPPRHNDSPRRSRTPEKVSKESPVGPAKKPVYSSTKYDSVTEDRKDTLSKSTCQSTDKETGYTRTSTTSPGKSREYSPTKSSPSKVSPEKKPAETLPTLRPSVSPDRKPSYMKSTTSTSSKFEQTDTNENRTENTLLKTVTSKRVETPKHSRTPSPTKAVTATDFIQYEREQEVLNRVQQSLRKLSPARDQRSSSRERSPGKTISLHDLEVDTELNIGERVHKYSSKIEEEKDNKSTTRYSSFPKDDKPKDRPSSKPSSRTTSPIKRPAPSKQAPEPKAPESPNKSRSISPKKPVSTAEAPKGTAVKPRDPTPTQLRKPTPITNGTKTEKNVTDVKKIASVIKQNSVSKINTAKSKITSPTKPEPELKRTPATKGINKENVSPKKEDVKVTRTASDNSIKAKKVSPQRMKSKPEIQVNDSPTPKAKLSSTKIQKEPQPKLAPKPKSATALNTAGDDDDDIIIDVELAKSSRESSPDRVCPTPVNAADDVSTPRYPDTVREPDEEFRRRAHHTIHETESLVDDIVEICEDEELFAKTTHLTASDECLLSVTDKVSKFTDKIDSIGRPKESTAQFKDQERNVHSDFVDENLRSDECLLSVSQKVNKFAKGSIDDTKDNRSTSRRIADEFDSQTTYQDDYTKLSVNDKAHFFVESAENAKTTKIKPTQKLERPNLNNVEESLRSDDCLLSVSDKVNKFVKTAEQFLSDSQETQEKDRVVREQYEKFMKNIENSHTETTKKTEVIADEETAPGEKQPKEKAPSFAKDTASSQTKVKDYASPNLKPTERTPTVKITTLRSSEAVKKAKALFENIASNTQKTTDAKTTKLTDIGVIKKSSKTDSTTVLRPSLDDGFPRGSDGENETDSRTSTPRQPPAAAPARGHAPSPSPSPARHFEAPRTKSPVRRVTEKTTTTTKTVLSRYPAAQQDTTKLTRPEQEVMHMSAPAAEPKHSRDAAEERRTPSKQTVEEIEVVSTRRGSGKFGVELRRTSGERPAPAAAARRRASDQLQPCIEDIYDLHLLDQMLEKVVGYEQRRRIRAQIRVAKKRTESEQSETTHSYARSARPAQPARSPDRRPLAPSPERGAKQKNVSPDRAKHTTLKTESSTLIKESTKLLNGHAKETIVEKRQRTQSPEKAKTPARQPSPDKRTRATSPTKSQSKTKPNRFNEYANAYMKKVGLNESDKLKFAEMRRKNTNIEDRKTEIAKSKTSTVNSRSADYTEETVETKTSCMSKSLTERKSSKDIMEVVRVNGKRSPSPGQRLYQRTPSPDFKRRASDRETVVTTVYRTETPTGVQTETIVKTVCEEPNVDVGRREKIIKTTYEIDKKMKGKQMTEEKPSWVTNRNLKKTSSETRTFSSSRSSHNSQSSQNTRSSQPPAAGAAADEITSGYGPGPCGADGRPLFGLKALKALRNGNTQVREPVAPEESVFSATHYSREEIETKDERAALQQFTASERRASGGNTVTTSPLNRAGAAGARGERSFLDSSTKVSGVQDILTRMKNADIVVEAGDSGEDAAARALLNKFLGATVLMAGMRGYVAGAGAGAPNNVPEQSSAVSSSSAGRPLRDIDVDQCWDERVLRKLLEESTDYEQRRRVRARIRTLMAEQEACAGAVAAALAAEPGVDGAGADADDAREEQEVTVTSSVRRSSTEKTVSSSTSTSTSTKTVSAPKPAPAKVSPFAKFRQLEKQNSTTSQNSSSPSPGAGAGAGTAPQSPGSPLLFKFTEPALQASALTIKERLLQWCRDKTRDYENVKLENFSTSWADGLAFCALLHHFLPTAFDYSKLTPTARRHNFTLAFKVADEKAGIYPLLDVDDMVAMRKPDWKCVFTYVQSIHRRFRDTP